MLAHAIAKLVPSPGLFWEKRENPLDERFTDWTTAVFKLYKQKPSFFQAVPETNLALDRFFLPAGWPGSGSGSSSTPSTSSRARCRLGKPAASSSPRRSGRRKDSKVTTGVSLRACSGLFLRPPQPSSCLSIRKTFSRSCRFEKSKNGLLYLSVIFMSESSR